eukprot:TRINITY_DN35669_c0_g1_i1.p1 TRINITY_DN35669_c0_g1~~TRINITY_DN35669_c0_g1_i1.p1  ORF type:complete len:308 (-),score=62.25 TRINITY_DN35669_c0_g1_i1:10-933(-)
MRVILPTAGYDHTIRFWEAASGKCYRTLQYPDSQINALAVTPDKQFLGVAGYPNVKLYEVTTANPNPVTNFAGHSANVTSIGFQKDGKWMYTASEDGTVKIWDMRAPGCQRDFECHAPVNTVALHPNQGELISGDQNGGIRVWDLTANRCTHSLTPDPDVAMRSVAIASDASIVVAASNTGKCHVWRLAKREDMSTAIEPFTTFNAHQTFILKCLISPDVRYIATCSADHTINMWDAEDFTLDQTLQGHQRWVWDGVFSADSAYLVTASSDHTARLWDLSTGESIRVYTGHHKAVVAVALNDNAPDA